ncbi:MULTISPECIES: hypothetical protein [Actinomadura]|uniref:Uncharacterized protein n=1 Tax=Actinomadura luteofluorescens TaxID=46163 RepID=A0A7Y9ECC1_9ACTN|nr:hypothetical protein [Actinomadura luteofluorescens]NYD44780.1 hypothetical protein [Actinomadura luteofluorescens]
MRAQLGWSQSNWRPDAVIHAKTELGTVNAYTSGSAYVVEAWDGDRPLPVFKETETLSQGSWGLRTVAESVTRWGSRFDYKGGKAVLTELRCRDLS